MHLLGVSRLRPRLLAHARDRRRGRARRARRPCGCRARAATSRPACAAPRAARRRGSCRAARTGCRARRRTARRCRRRASRCGRRAGPASTSRKPSTSIASVRQSSTVWRTIGCSIGTSIGPPGSVSGQASACGKAAASRSSARIRRSGAGTRLPLRERSSSSERCTFQRQRVSNIGAASSAWTSTSRAVVGLQVVEDVLEREAVLRAEREHDRLLVGRGLQLEAEADAEALAQRQAPGAVDAAAERRVHDELHAAALVEEALEHDARLRGHRAERAPPGLDVLGDLPRRALRELGAAGLEQAGDGVVSARGRGFAQRRDLGRELARAARRLAQPEGDRRRLRPSRRPRARCRARRAGSATRCCRAGRCRPRSTRSRSPR